MKLDEEMPIDTRIAYGSWYRFPAAPLCLKQVQRHPITLRNDYRKPDSFGERVMAGSVSAQRIDAQISASSLLGTSAIADTGAKISNSVLVSTALNPVILKNEVLLNRDSTNYTEVRHIVLKGTNEQIGKVLGEIAQEDYSAKPGRFVDPVYAKAHLIYMQKNYPAFYERMKGVAESLQCLPQLYGLRSQRSALRCRVSWLFGGLLPAVCNL
jgi:hypothetical protein